MGAGRAVYTGLAAVDVYLGATQLRQGDPANMYHPGEFRYGGGHVIEDLVAGKSLQLFALSYGTDCYPLREMRTWFTIQDLNQAIMVNPRNCYQNYNVAVNDSDKTIYTYMGMLEPNMQERQLLFGRAALAALERPVLRDHRHRHPHLAGRRARPRLRRRHTARRRRRTHARRRPHGRRGDVGPDRAT